MSIKNSKHDRYQIVWGEPLKKISPRPPLSAIKVVEHRKGKAAKSLQVDPKRLAKHRDAHLRYVRYKGELERRTAQQILQSTDEAFKAVEDARDLVSYRREAKKALRPLQAVAPFEISPACRFRQITIKECLTEVCSNQEEIMEIGGNFGASVAEPLHVVPGPNPEFTITDCVDAGNGYTLSDGQIWVGATVQMTQSALVKEIGVKFSGQAWTDVDGEDHWISGDEWGVVWVASTFDAQSKAPNGSYISLTVPEGEEFVERNEQNRWGPTAAKPLDLKKHSVALNINATANHEFLMDYLIKWEVFRSDDYNSSSCFGLTNLSIRPYIVYETCHNEYQQVLDFYLWLSQSMKAGAKAKTLMR